MSTPHEKDPVDQAGRDDVVTTTPNKPDGALEDEGGEVGVTPVEERGPAKTQSTVTPEDYPDSDGGKPDYKQ